MHPGRKIPLSILLAAACVLGVFVWAEARSAAMFADADFREATKTQQEAAKGTAAATAKKEQKVFRLFERVVATGRSAYLTATFCSVGVVLLSMASLVAIWYPPAAKTPGNLPGATPGAQPSAESSPSSDVTQR